MSTKRKKEVNIISFSKGNVPRPKKESDDSSQTTIKTCPDKKGHFIQFAKYLIAPQIPIQKEKPKEDTFDERVNPNECEAFSALSPDIERNRINSSRDLAIFLIFAKLNLYNSKFDYFLILFILNNIYERNFLNLIDFFAELSIFNLLFPLSINDILITALNTIKNARGERRREERGEERRRDERGEERREEKRGEERRREERGEERRSFFYWETRGDSAKLLFRTRKWPF